MKLTAVQIALYAQAPIMNAQRFEEPLNAAMERFAINTPRRIAAFLATVSIESARLTQLEEGLYYKDATRLRSLYPRAFKSVAEAEPYTRNPRGLSQKLYGGYHGRGLIQLTWRENYERASEALGFDYVSAPSVVLQPEHAALTAAWYWDAHHCNDAADDADMEEVTRLVNGPRKLHLEERIAVWNAALPLLEAA